MKWFFHKSDKKTEDMDFNIKNVDIGLFRIPNRTNRVIALHGDKVIGVLYVVFNLKEKYNVFDFNVDVKYRNKGVGRRMIQFLKTICDKNYDIDLEVKKDNNIAMKLYKSEGFEITRDCGYYYEMTCKKRE